MVFWTSGSSGCWHIEYKVRHMTRFPRSSLRNNPKVQKAAKGMPHRKKPDNPIAFRKARKRMSGTI